MLRRKTCFLSVTVLFVLSALPLIAQAGASSMMWSQTYGRADMDACTSMIQTADGGYLLAGFTRSFAEGKNDAWLVKTDEYGNMEWNRTYGEAEVEEYAGSLIQTADGGYAFAGTKVEGNDQWSIRGYVWLVKTDESGNLEWSRTYGGAETDSPYALLQTPEGGYAVAGQTNGFGDGNNDLWLIKTDPNGNMEWNRTYGGPDAESNPYALVQTADAGFALAGQTYSFGAGYADCWLVKTDWYGNMEWNRSYGGTGMDYATSLIETPEGGFALAGCTDSFGAGGYDFWLIKTDEHGIAEWNQTYGLSNQDTNPSLVQTANGDYALAGYTHPDLADLMLVKTDNQGNMKWTRTYPGQAIGGLPSLVQTNDGGYALAASKGFHSANKDDFWLIKTNEYGIIPENSHLSLGVLAIGTVLLILKIALNKRQRKQK